MTNPKELSELDLNDLAKRGVLEYHAVEEIRQLRKILEVAKKLSGFTRFIEGLRYEAIQLDELEKIIDGIWNLGDTK